MNNEVSFDVLKGAVLVEVRGAESGSDYIRFVAADGRSWEMHHEQDCCESVTVHEVIGDIDDLIGTPILSATAETNGDDPRPEYSESWTWTFYRIITIRGTVVIRWLGESNGYYSEGVDFSQVA